MISIKNCDIGIKRPMRKFYANFNILSRKFSKCSPDVKCTVTAMKRLRIAYNSLRRLLGIPKHNSVSEMFAQLNIKSFGELMRNSIFSFMNRLLQCSSNVIL